MEPTAEFDALILGNGEYPSHEQAVRLLHAAPYVVCCDGAANEYIRRGHIPQAIVGDIDSLSAANQEQFAAIVHHSSDQDTNDQTKAVMYLLGQGKRRILILGATGKREDHTLGNISLLMEYQRAGAQIQMMTDYGVFIPALGNTTFYARPGQQVSIFNVGRQLLQGQGLVYPLSNFSDLWQGTLNEAVGTEFTVHSTGEYLVFKTLYTPSRTNNNK